MEIYIAQWGKLTKIDESKIQRPIYISPRKRDKTDGERLW